MAGPPPLMPLYGFVEGDTMGVVVLVDLDAPVSQLANRLVEAASVRVAPRPGGRVIHHERPLDPTTTPRREGVTPLDRVDLVWSLPLDGGPAAGSNGRNDRP